ncbi:MAG TPA: OmpA family protein, partial [Myxococcota bacterium]|nr:OmpA family protein [Myxococcota bacterium]
ARSGEHDWRAAQASYAPSLGGAADRFEDGDGCPDLDNDGDGVPDVRDGHLAADGSIVAFAEAPAFGACLNDAEDADGFEDADGCPDPDNDGDGVADRVDGHRDASGAVVTRGVNGDCADQAEVVNGVDDADGCPDEAKARVTDVEIKVEPIYFDYGKASVRKDSLAVLDAVVTILKTYPQIRKIEIQGHTDSRGSDSFNLDLSQRRVDAARAYIISKGVEADRLVSRGYGETMPLAPNATTEEEHQLNRRVVFLIVEKAEGAPRVAP